MRKNSECVERRDGSQRVDIIPDLSGTAAVRVPGTCGTDRQTKQIDTDNDRFAR